MTTSAENDALVADLRDLLANHTIEAYSPALRFEAVAADALRAVLDQHEATRVLSPGYGAPERGDQP